MPKVSVIVAVYAAEKYLGRCLDSLLAQTLTEYEVLLIDDGSLDCSGNICDSYAAQDRRFKVFHKMNGGVSSARQMGLSLASGEYVIHVDPDDWVEPNMLENLYRCARATDADMVVCDFFCHNNDECSYINQKPRSLDNNSVLNEMFGNLHGYCWNKLVKRTCILQNGVDFFPDMVVWEDLLFCVRMLKQSIRISYLPQAFYHYIRNENGNSLVDAASRRKVDSMKLFIDCVEKEFPNIDEKLLKRRKIEAKRTAFLIDDISKAEFENLYADVDYWFRSKTSDKKKIDKLIYFANKHSWQLSRFILKLWKMKNSLWRKS